MSSNIENKKARLQEESDKFEDSLSEEVSEFSDKAVELAEKALIIGGGALLSYLVVRMILGKNQHDEEKEGGRERIVIKSSSHGDVFLKSLTDKAVLVLLELAREVIVKFLKDLPDKDEA
jgi:hypothetical protein